MNGDGDVVAASPASGRCPRGRAQFHDRLAVRFRPIVNVDVQVFRRRRRQRTRMRGDAELVMNRDPLMLTAAQRYVDGVNLHLAIKLEVSVNLPLRVDA